MNHLSTNRARQEGDRSSRRSTTILAPIVATCVLVGCIKPPPKTGNEGEASSESDLTVAEKVAALDLVPVVPDDALIWDGANISLTNIDPPGSWYSFNDATPGGEMLPPSVDEFEANIIDGAIHTEGKGFREWGGGIGMNFVGSPMLTPVDASSFRGISFKASGEGWVHVGLGAIATMPEFEICNMAGKKCYDHFAVDLKLTDEPQVIELTWDKLKQAGWGSPQTTLEPATIVALTFTSRGASAWNFNIDDVSFLK